jgi:neutral amino acid transport system permease protein
MDTQLIANGLVSGCIIALAAIGLSMIYRILNFANFAHGDFLSLGAFLTYALASNWKINFILAALLSIISISALGVVLDKIIWKPMRNKKASRVSLMISSIGLALIIRNLLSATFGPDIQRLPLPVKEGLYLWGVVLTENQIIVMIIAVLSMFAVHYLLSRTNVGKAMRALSDDMNLAKVCGIYVERVIMATWAIGLGIAAIAGIMYGLITNINPNMGWFMILPVFAAAILGGIGNPYGAMAGGIVIGLAQELSTVIIPSEYKVASSFVIMIAVLLIRPKGIMGGI